MSKLFGVLASLLLACQHIPDPCAGYPLACLAVTVESGPRSTYQLSVVVEGYGSSTPLTPRQRPDDPLTYPLRFAVRFAMFDRQHTGQVTLDVSSLDADDQVNGEARVNVAIDNTDKRQLVLDLGAPLDLAGPPDLLKAPDLTESPDLLPGPDLSSDLSNGGGGN